MGVGLRRRHGPVSGAAFESHAYTCPGLFPVTLTVTGTCGSVEQTDTYTSSVWIEEVAAGIVVAPEPGCVAAPIYFTSTSAVTGTIAAYLWEFGDGTTSPVSQTSHLYAAAGIYPVTLTVTTTGGCSSFATDTVSVEEALASFVHSPEPACVLQTVLFTSTSAITATGASYLWDFGDGSTDTVPQTTHSYTSAGNYTATLTVTTAAGCADTFSELVHVEDVVASFTSLPNPVCVLQTVSLTSTSAITAAGASYLWEFGDGATAPGATASHAYPSTGAFVVTLTVTTTAGCSDSVSQIVEVQDVLAGFTAGPDPVCVLTTVAFTNTSVVTPTGPATYQWDFGDGTTSPAFEPTHQYVSAGTYNVILTTTTSAGCADTFNDTITVEDLDASFTVSPNPVCVLSQVNFNNTSAVTATTASYLWSFGDGVTATAASPTHTYNTAGSYTAVLTVTTGAGCVETVSRPVSVEFADASFVISRNPACILESLTFTNTSVITAPSGVIYQWNFGDGSTSNAADPTHQYAVPGTYFVSLFILTNGGCVDVYLTSVDVDGVDAAFALSPNPACILSQVYFTSTSVYSGPTASYLWNFGDGGTAATANASHSYAAAGTYPVTLAVTNSVGCSDVATGTVTIEDLDVSFTRGAGAGLRPAADPIHEYQRPHRRRRIVPVELRRWGDSDGTKPDARLRGIGQLHRCPDGNDTGGCVESASRVLHVEDAVALVLSLRVSPPGPIRSAY